MLSDGCPFYEWQDKPLASHTHWPFFGPSTLGCPSAVHRTMAPLWALLVIIKLNGFHTCQRTHSSLNWTMTWHKTGCTRNLTVGLISVCLSMYNPYILQRGLHWLLRDLHMTQPKWPRWCLATSPWTRAHNMPLAHQKGFSLCAKCSRMSMWQPRIGGAPPILTTASLNNILILRHYWDLVWEVIGRFVGVDG